VRFPNGQLQYRGQLAVGDVEETINEFGDVTTGAIGVAGGGKHYGRDDGRRYRELGVNRE
jgi:hypothetical protein